MNFKLQGTEFSICAQQWRFVVDIFKAVSAVAVIVSCGRYCRSPGITAAGCLQAEWSFLWRQNTEGKFKQLQSNHW